VAPDPELLQIGSSSVSGWHIKFLVVDDHVNAVSKILGRQIFPLTTASLSLTLFWACTRGLLTGPVPGYGNALPLKCSLHSGTMDLLDSSSFDDMFPVHFALALRILDQFLASSIQ
jgi:hypothetical protein